MNKKLLTYCERHNLDYDVQLNIAIDRYLKEKKVFKLSLPDDEIKRIIDEHYERDTMGIGRKEKKSLYRQINHYIFYKFKYSNQKIIIDMFGVHRTMIYYSVKKVNDLLDTDPEFRMKFVDLIYKLDKENAKEN